MYNEFLNLKKMERLWSGQASGSLCCSSKRLSLQSRALTLHLGGFLELRMQRGLQVNTGASINILQWLLELKTPTRGACYSLLCQIGNTLVHFHISWKALSGFCLFLICHSWSRRGACKGGEGLTWGTVTPLNLSVQSVPTDSNLKKHLALN